MAGTIGPRLHRTRNISFIRTVTYVSLGANSTSVWTTWRKACWPIGITHGTHVGVWATNVPDWLTFLYAGAKIGAVLVTINTNYKQSELEYLVENADIHTMCITDGVFDGSYVDMVYTMLPELKTSQRGYLKSKRFPRLRNVVYIGQEKYRGMYNTPEMLLLGQNIKDETLEAAKARVNCHDVVNMQYTSGTTASRKGSC